MTNNMSVGPNQFVAKCGNLRYKQVYYKVTESYVAKKITAAKDKSNKNDIMEETLHLKNPVEQYLVPHLSNTPKSTLYVINQTKKRQ